MKLADLIPEKGWSHIDFWMRDNLIKTSGDTQWRQPTERDWYKVNKKLWVLNAVRAGRIPELPCEYRRPKVMWYGDKLPSLYDPIWGGMAIPGQLYVSAAKWVNGVKKPKTFMDMMWGGPRAYWQAA